jgi:hypothetical protein
MGDGASVLDPVAKREQVLLGPLFAVLRSGCLFMRSTPIPAPNAAQATLAGSKSTVESLKE